MSDHVYIIAEAGVNHNGDISLAKKLIDAAFESGADAVKFQTFKADKIVTKTAPKAEYQTQNTGAKGSQNEMLKKLELTEDEHVELVKYASEKRITFLSTPFDIDSLNLLVGRLKLKTIKVSSGDLTNSLLLLELARKNVEVILSTGMSTLKEVEEALSVLAFGFLFPNESPTFKKFTEAFQNTESKKILKKKVTLLHCVTNYPAPFEEVNLRAMQTMRETFQLPIGFSDHTLGVAVPIAAVALGAKVVEKHFTLDRNMKGPDHKASLEPEELKLMVTSIRQIEKAMGSPLKEPTTSELKVAKVARRSLIASKNIKEGEIFTKNNLTVKRPAQGLSPMQYWDLLGQKANRDYSEDEMIE